MFSAFPNHSVHSLCSNPQLNSVMTGKNKYATAMLHMNFQPIVLPNKQNQIWRKASVINRQCTHKLLAASNSEQGSKQFAGCQETFTGGRNQLQSSITFDNETVIIYFKKKINTFSYFVKLVSNTVISNQLVSTFHHFNILFPQK